MEVVGACISFLFCTPEPLILYWNFYPGSIYNKILDGICSICFINFSYDDQLLVQFNIDCGEGNLAYFNITSLNIQGPEDCEDQDGNKRYSYFA